jgi:hypothetical protein
LEKSEIVCYQKTIILLNRENHKGRVKDQWVAQIADQCAGWTVFC